jgi:hypothetical protein
MVHTTNGDSPRPSSRTVARLLLETARQDPSLLGRSHVVTSRPVGNPFLGLSAAPAGLLPMSLVPTQQQDISQQIEELVSIAVVSAQHAEDALRHANEANGVARRSMKIFASVGVLGMLVGAGAIADHHLFGPGGAMVAAAEATTSAAPPPVDLPQPASPQTTGQPTPTVTPQLVAVQPSNPALPPKPVQAGQQTAAATPVPAQPVRPMARIVVPVYHPPPPSQAASWPPKRPTRPYRTATSGRVVYPPFFLALRRDVAALFQRFPGS